MALITRAVWLWDDGNDRHFEASHYFCETVETLANFLYRAPFDVGVTNVSKFKWNEITVRTRNTIKSCLLYEMCNDLIDIVFQYCTELWVSCFVLYRSDKFEFDISFSMDELLAYTVAKENIRKQNLLTFSERPDRQYDTIYQIRELIQDLNYVGVFAQAAITVKCNILNICLSNNLTIRHL